MKYKGYSGSVEEDFLEGGIVGKVLGITDTVLYESETIEGIEAAFQKAVDGYIDVCERHNIEPKREEK